MTANPKSDQVSFELKFEVPAHQLYHALVSKKDGPVRWWTRFCEVQEEPGKVSHFRFPKAGFYCKMKNEKLEFARRVEWLCVEASHAASSGWKNLRDWEGTRPHFEIREDGQTACTLKFTHAGLTPELECRDVCEKGWRFYLDESLRAYLETGRGCPYADNSANNIAAEIN